VLCDNKGNPGSQAQHGPQLLYMGRVAWQPSRGPVDRSTSLQSSPARTDRRRLASQRHAFTRRCYERDRDDDAGNGKRAESGRSSMAAARIGNSSWLAMVSRFGYRQYSCWLGAVRWPTRCALLVTIVAL
jgi:hypothetical protein